jgi:dihydrofolate reductase
MGSGALLVGRATYEMLAPYWSSMKNDEFGIADQMNNLPKCVVSSTLRAAGWKNSTIIKGNVVGEVTKLKQQHGRDILIPGSATLVQSLTEAELVDEYRVLVHPIVMGSGKRFFRDGVDTTKLQLARTQTLSLGVVLLCYVPSGKTEMVGSAEIEQTSAW